MILVIHEVVHIAPAIAERMVQITLMIVLIVSLFMIVDVWI